VTDYITHSHNSYTTNKWMEFNLVDGNHVKLKTTVFDLA